ncbi:oligosaccharide flippase family protein [Planococcus sp. CPCC 101016]|uniref:oligosaccharide flippase family protein n=1 Tax=Planococcus sp. CPCC 101016 TaxID=2599617 RepID=UPI0011B5A29A|nr:polysaccharide biosynthesis C-terminal domain-containing protein [Planococcus sp. CPCC 101016]TWT07043.1 oligosaccharide flippase family protein [Planococcus sp. CPCC 101016]
MNSYKKLLNNSLIFAVGSLGVKLISLFLLPLYTFYLTPSQFGTVDLMTVTATLVIPIFTLSISNSILRFVMDKNYDKESVLINSLFVSALGIFVLILSYPLIILIFPFKEYIEYYYIFLVVQILNSLLAQYVRANGSVKLFAINGIVTSLLLLVSNVLFLVILEMSIKGYLLSFITAFTLSSVFIFFYGNIKKDINVKKFNKPLLKEMLIFSIPLIPNALMWWIMGVSDRYLITYYMGLSSVGLYAVAVRIPSILNIINSVFFQAWQMSAIEEADSKEKSLFYTTVFNVFSLTMLIMTSLILLFLKLLMGLIVSDAFFEAWRYVPFLLLGVVFSSFSGFLGTNYIASKKTAGVLKTSIIGGLLNITLNIILIPILGINGAAIATMISFFIVWVLRIRDTKKFVEIKLNTFKLSFTISLIFLQIFIMYCNINQGDLLELFIFIIIVLINYKEIVLLLNKVKKKVLKK